MKVIDPTCIQEIIHNVITIMNNCYNIVCTVKMIILFSMHFNDAT